MTLFAFATLAPVVLIALASFIGGGFGWAALAFLTALTASLDLLIRRAAPDAPDGVEFPAADALSVTLALSHFGLLALCVWVLSGGSGLVLLEKLPLFAAAGLFFGQVSNSNAHELIHKPSRQLAALGRWVYITLLFGHHVSAHTRVHHRLVGTRADPNTARLGESFYRYAVRAWRGSFRAGYREESALRARSDAPRRHPYVDYIAGAALSLAIAALIGGLSGLLWFLALAGFAQVQLLMSDYVQHYGLTRNIVDGKPEPIAPHHSWNAPSRFSSALMLNAPRHSDHHAHPSRPYPALRLGGEDEVPTLPQSLPVMACVALLPSLWRRSMDPRVSAWSARQPTTDGSPA